MLRPPLSCPPMTGWPSGGGGAPVVGRGVDPDEARSWVRSCVCPGRRPESPLCPSSSRTTMAVREKRSSCSICWRLRANSIALAGRASGFLLIAWARSRSRDWGTSARPVLGGGLDRMRGMSSRAELSPPGTSKGDRPTSSCHRVADRAYTSARASPLLWPKRTSGGAHGIETPRSSSSSSRAPPRPAMPKSVRPGEPYWLTSTLAGLMSRWMTPARCAVSTALASWMPVRSTSSTEKRAVRARWARLGGG